MTDTSQSVIRIAALVAATVLFAAVWRSDQTGHELALQTSPGSRVIVRREQPGVRMPTSRPEWQAALVLLDGEGDCPAVIQKDSSGMKLVTARCDGLTLDLITLGTHLRQLPLDIPAGDYRIVDSAGGVGWLRVQTDAARAASSRDALLTTRVNSVEVRFIRVTANSTAVRDSLIRR